MDRKMEKRILGAVIANEQGELDAIVSRLKDSVDWMQLDVMDGSFVPNKSLEFDFRLPETGNKYEAQLMVKDPGNWIRRNAEKFDSLLIHTECCRYPSRGPERMLDLGRELCKKVGLALRPETPVETIKPFLDRVDEVLVMTVEPGAYGGMFQPPTLEKVRTLRKMNPELDIEVDGGIDDYTIRLAYEAGSNFFVSGSYLLKSDNVGQAVERLKRSIGLK